MTSSFVDVPIIDLSKTGLKRLKMVWTWLSSMKTSPVFKTVQAAFQRPIDQKNAMKLFIACIAAWMIFRGISVIITTVVTAAVIAIMVYAGFSYVRVSRTS